MATTKSGWMVMEKTWEEVQKKTFTKWCNSHLVKKFSADAAISNLAEDFQTGVKLMQLINALYGTPIPKHKANPTMRPMKLDNIELAMRMVDQAGIKTNFLKTHHLVDCDQKMILGMIWAIILDFQIKGISEEDLSAKEGLLLWCKKKTAGYKDVKVENFTSSWQDGLAFCALIHKHRPDLLDFDKLSKENPRENLELAFDVAEKQLGIPRLLDIDDIVDVPRPDERSVMTYLSEYFHCFSAQNEAQIAGRRIAKLVALAKSNDELKNDYLQRARALVDWINQNSEDLQDRNYDNTLESIEKLWDEFKGYKKTTKPEKTATKLELEQALNTLQAKLRLNNRPPFQPPEDLTTGAIDQKWEKMGRDETDRAEWLRKEIERQQKIENLASRFWRKAAVLLGWGQDNLNLVSSTDLGNSVAEVEAKLKILEGYSANYSATQRRMDDTKQLGEQLLQENYSKADEVTAKLQELDAMWSGLKEKADSRKEALEKELERQKRLEEMRVQFANQSRVLIGWMDDAEDTLGEPIRVGSLEAAQELQSSFKAISEDAQTQEPAYSALVDLSNQLAEEGITDNMYAAFTMEQVTERWTRLHNEINERGSALDAEETRHKENEELCKEFAEKTKAFTDWADQQKEELVKGTEGELEEQLANIKSKMEEIADKSVLDEIEQLNQKIDERNIIFNRYTDASIETVTLVWEKLNDLALKQQSIIEKAMMEQGGSNVPEELLAEFKDTFKTFDKDGTGSLEKPEFKACLSALGYDISEDQLDKLMKEIGKTKENSITFEEFVDYMVKKVEDSDTPASIQNAFKSISGNKDTVTEEDLRRALDAETVDYLLQNMPNQDGKYDYKAFTDGVYSS